MLSERNAVEYFDCAIHTCTIYSLSEIERSLDESDANGVATKSCYLTVKSTDALRAVLSTSTE